MLFNIWLVVTFQLGEESRSYVIEDSMQPSIEICLSREAAILASAAKVKGEDGWELAVSCQIKKHKETPASDPQIDEDDPYDH